MKESVITAKILKALRGRGGVWWKIHGGATQTTGIPDIIGCYRGLFVAVEVKVPGAGRLSERQRLTLERIATAGGILEVATTTMDALALVDSIDTMLDSAGC
jgi:Holliday junction resolvase